MPEQAFSTGKDDRKKWLAILEQVSQPVLEAISLQKLHATIPVECAKGGERYISTGSLYLCAGAWQHLGLPATDDFWSAPAEPWTQQNAWSGVDIKTDHAIGE
jgi:hypothetical protein